MLYGAGLLPVSEFVESFHDDAFTRKQAALDDSHIAGLRPEDGVLFLLSGGGSALFEKPLVSLEELQDITRQLLACGADIR